MNVNRTIQAIHALACLRHTDALPGLVGVVLSPLVESKEGLGIGRLSPGPGSNPGEPLREVAEVCEWRAQVRLGPGTWLDLSGQGKTPEGALDSLHRHLLEAHTAIDARRAGALERLSGQE